MQHGAKRRFSSTSRSWINKKNLQCRKQTRFIRSILLHLHEHESDPSRLSHIFKLHVRNCYENVNNYTQDEWFIIEIPKGCRSSRRSWFSDKCGKNYGCFGITFETPNMSAEYSEHHFTILPTSSTPTSTSKNYFGPWYWQYNYYNQSLCQLMWRKRIKEHWILAQVVVDFSYVPRLS